MNERIATVIGGTGFLGRRVVHALAASGYSVRIAARRPGKLERDAPANVARVRADIRDEASIQAALAGAHLVVNAVSLFVEKRGLTFEDIHVVGAERVARCAHDSGAAQLIHVSGIGARADSPSRFIRARARGEEVVRARFAQAVMVRPSVMVGRDDALLSSLESMTRFPVIPLFGKGDSRLQPAWVEDVAGAIAALAQREDMGGRAFEFGGAQVCTFREALRVVMAQLGREKRLLLPVPFALWNPIVAALGVLPNPPLTRDQLILMRADNVVSPQADGFAALDIRPHSFAEVVALCLPAATR